MILGHIDSPFRINRTFTNLRLTAVAVLSITQYTTIYIKHTCYQNFEHTHVHYTHYIAIIEHRECDEQWSSRVQFPAIYRTNIFAVNTARCAGAKCDDVCVKHICWWSGVTCSRYVSSSACNAYETHGARWCCCVFPCGQWITFQWPSVVVVVCQTFVFYNDLFGEFN